jgi:hypothetical protein
MKLQCIHLMLELSFIKFGTRVTKFYAKDNALQGNKTIKKYFNKV